jgi:hypothetical protein
LQSHHRKTQYHEFEEKLKSVLTKAEELRRDLTKMIEEDVQPFDALMCSPWLISLLRPLNGTQQRPDLGWRRFD